MINLIIILTLSFLQINICTASDGYAELVKERFYIGIGPSKSQIFVAHYIRPDHRLEDVLKHMRSERQENGMNPDIQQSELNTAPAGRRGQLFRDVYEYAQSLQASAGAQLESENIENLNLQTNQVDQQLNDVLSPLMPEQPYLKKDGMGKKVYQIAYDLSDKEKNEDKKQRSSEKGDYLYGFFKNGGNGPGSGKFIHQIMANLTQFFGQTPALLKWAEDIGEAPGTPVHQKLPVSTDVDSAVSTVLPSKHIAGLSEHNTFPYQNTETLSIRGFDFLSLLNPFPLLKMIALDVAHVFIFFFLILGTVLLAPRQLTNMRKHKA